MTELVTNSNNHSYTAIPDGGIDEESLEVRTSVTQPKIAMRIGWVVVVFIANFMFYYYCITRALSPMDYESGRRLSSEEDCTPEKASISTTVGVAIGTGAVLLAFVAIGLTPIGPIAGGLFAANMGAGIASGSLMALTQAAAMTGGAYATGAGLGAVAGATYACASTVAHVAAAST